jgi:hypothetical protein
LKYLISLVRHVLEADYAEEWFAMAADMMGTTPEEVKNSA